MYKKYYHKNYYKKKDESNSSLGNILQAILGFGLLYGFAKIPVLMTWYRESIVPNFGLIVTVGLLSIGFALFLYFWNIYRKDKLKAQLLQEKQEQLPEFILEVTAKIQSFVPVKLHDKEELYQMELVGYLKNFYPDIQIEIQKDYAKPDILIGDIAIEIKGPTTMEGLKTLPDKINKYLPAWDFLLIVLFDIRIIPYRNREENMKILEEKKAEILSNLRDEKKEKVSFIVIHS